MKNKKLVFTLIAGFALLYACTKDFIEVNLSGKKISLISPDDNLHTTILSVVFWWNKIDGATKYNLQIVKPNFSSVQQLLLDSNITDDHFSFSLTPGTYQWRVRGFNGSSKTDYSARTLYIDSTTSLSGQTVVLDSPKNGYLSNSTAKILFKWDSLYIANDYRFQIIDSSGATLVDKIVTEDTVSYTPQEGKYTWQVRAQNATSNTLYSSRTFTIDITPPPVSTLLKPVNGDSVLTPDTLTWSRNTQAIGDSLFIYPDSLISSAVVNVYTTNTTYIFPGTVNKKYFWRLKSTDAAGNWSGYCTLRKFIAK